MTPSNYHVFPLAIALRISSDGISVAEPLYTFVDLPTPRGMPEAVLRASSLEVITLMKGGPANNELEFNLELIGGIDRDNEVAPILPNGGANISVNDTIVRATPYTTVASFLPHCRPRIKLRNKANTAGVRSAIIWVFLLVKVST